MARDEFSLDTKRRLAQRAGYLCSICGIITVGPSDEGLNAVNVTGVAAHITAAASGGKRYDKNLNPDQRSDINNGIWLCTTHADLIDGDQVFYTKDYVDTIKNNHEQRIKFQQSGVNTEKGLIAKIELSNFGFVTEEISLDFTDRNILKGSNGVGKTLILELIASISDKSRLNRWVKYRKIKVNSYCNIFYFKDRTNKFSVHINSQDKISYEYNGESVPFTVPTMTILFIKESYSVFVNRMSSEEQKGKSLLDSLSKYFNLTKHEFIDVIGGIMRTKKYFFNDINIDTENDDLVVKLKSDINSDLHPFDELSRGEQDRVLLEITLKIATYHAKFNSTILLIENSSFGIIDKKGIDYLFEIIREEKLGFQFFFATTEIEVLDKKGFRVFELINRGQNGVEVIKL